MSLTASSSEFEEWRYTVETNGNVLLISVLAVGQSGKSCSQLPN